MFKRFLVEQLVKIVLPYLNEALDEYIHFTKGTEADEIVIDLAQKIGLAAKDANLSEHEVAAIVLSYLG